MSRKNKLTVGDVRYALKACDGLISEAAKFLATTPATLSSYIDDNPQLKVTINEARGGLADLAERRLRDLVDAGKEQSVLFVMKTLGKDRGYGETASRQLDGQIKLSLPQDFPED